MKLSVAIKVSWDIDDTEKAEEIQKVLKKLNKITVVKDLEPVEGTNVYKENED